MGNTLHPYNRQILLNLLAEYFIQIYIISE